MVILTGKASISRTKNGYSCLFQYSGPDFMFLVWSEMSFKLKDSKYKIRNGDILKIKAFKIFKNKMCERTEVIKYDLRSSQH
jgi:hypothetical protein